MYSIELYDLLSDVDKREYVLDLLKEYTNIKSQVSSLILNPEARLIESQILMLQDRSIGVELSLEDVKKLDLLLKNKQTISGRNILPEYKVLPNSKLLELAKA